MQRLSYIVTVLIKIFLIGLLLQFLLQTFFTYKLGYDGGVRTYIWLWKEVLILVFMLIVAFLLYKKAKEVWRKAVRIWLKSQKVFKFLVFFSILCVVSFIVAVGIQGVGVWTYILSAKYDLLGFFIFLLGVFIASLLPLQTKWNRRYNELLKWIIYWGFVRWAIIAFLPSLLKLFGYSRNSFEWTLSGNPPAVYYTQIDKGLARNQFLFERPISFWFFLIAFWPLFALTYLRRLSRRDQLWWTLAFWVMIFSTYSRAAIGVRVLQTGLLLLLRYPKYAKQIVLKIGIPAVIVFIIATFSLKSVFMREHSNTGHFKLLVSGIEIWLERPFVGRGAGYSGPASHQLCFAAEANPRCDKIRAINKKYSMETPWYNPENQYVQIFMEYWLLGLIPWMLCFCWLLWESLKLIKIYMQKVRKAKKYIDQKLITRLLITISFWVGLAGLAVEGLVLHSFVDRMIVYPFMMLFGLRRWANQDCLSSNKDPELPKKR